MEAEHNPELAKVGWSFIPAAFHTFSAPGPSAQRLLAELTQRAASDLEGWEKTRLLAELRQLVVLALARSVGEQLMLFAWVQESLLDY